MSLAVAVEPRYKKYWLTPVPLVQLKVTEEEVKVEPGGGLLITAALDAVPVPVTGRVAPAPPVKVTLWL